MSETDKVVYEVDKKVATIRLNRPEALNALDKDVLETLPKLFDEAEHDPKVHALVITGTGEKALTAGLDTKMLSQASPENDIVNMVLTQGNKMATKLIQMKKPTAVAVNGLAMGWGMISAMLVDFRFAVDEPSVFFALSELDAGVYPATAAAYGAVMNFGVKKAQEMLLTAKRYSVQEMQAMNFITAAVPREQLMEETMKVMSKIARRPTHLLYLSKATINMHAARIFNDAVALEYEMYNFMKEKENQNDEAIDAFLKLQWAKFPLLPREGEPWGSE
jgi:enoyl-CoA hydratase/carnithine racemase